MLRTAELSIVESRTEPESGVAEGNAGHGNGHAENGHAENGHAGHAANGHAGNGHAANGHGHANGGAEVHGDGHPCCTPPLEAAWLERVETHPLRRTPDDVERSDVLPSPCGEG